MTPVTEAGALAAQLGHRPNEPTWPADTSREPVPMTLFGKDHWATFAYVETRTVDHRGLLDHDHMRCSVRRHPAMANAKTRVPSAAADGSAYPTRIKASNTPAADGTYAVRDLPEHDDYDCLDDLIAADLLEPKMPTVAHGVFVDTSGRPVSAGDDVIRPEFVTGLDEKVLATRALWTLTTEGQRVAQKLRAHKAAGGNWHNFSA